MGSLSGDTTAIAAFSSVDADPPRERRPEFPWYAIRTRSNRERAAATVLEAKGYDQYLPLYGVRRQWSDRVVTTEVPLFAGYVFCRFDHRQRLPIITVPGVVSVVGFGNEPAPIPDSEIEAIQVVLQSGLPAQPCSFMREGQRVRITDGSLKDVEGILVKKKTNWRLVVSVTMLQRSVSIELDSSRIASL